MRAWPFACDGRDDGLRDVLIGLSDGKVHLFEGGKNLPGRFSSTDSRVNRLARAAFRRANRPGGRP